MAEQVIFPDTVEEYMEQYSIVDTDKVYTNGSELVPVFRMRQWFEHVKTVGEKAEAELRELKEELEYYRRINEQHAMEVSNARLNGVIEGLKYSVRCNGISGAELKE